MKNYHGERTEEGTRVWWVDDADGSTGVLPHHVLHSPDGFEWGYSGSGPADLARSLLWDVLGVAPETAQYQTFKEDTVAGWKTAKWSINAEDESVKATVREQVSDLCARFPVYADAR